MDNTGKVHDIGAHNRNIKTDQGAILGAVAHLGIQSKIGNTGGAQCADVQSSGRVHRRRRGAEGVAFG